MQSQMEKKLLVARGAGDGGGRHGDSLEARHHGGCGYGRENRFVHRGVGDEPVLADFLAARFELRLHEGITSVAAMRAGRGGRICRAMNRDIDRHGSGAYGTSSLTARALRLRGRTRDRCEGAKLAVSDVERDDGGGSALKGIGESARGRRHSSDDGDVDSVGGGEFLRRG